MPPPDALLSRVEAISESHDVSRFDCGAHPSLNDWLKRFALANQKNESARTYVIHRDRSVVGYYSISAGSVSIEESPARIAKGLARHPIPVILLARLAVDEGSQGKWPGQSPLKRDALQTNCPGRGDIVGARAKFLVHAIDELARKVLRIL